MIGVQDFFNRSADASIARLKSAMWVGVTERMEESVCLLFLQLRKGVQTLPKSRFKIPRPISVWSDEAKEKVRGLDHADTRVYEVANRILDLRLRTAKEEVKKLDQSARNLLGECYEVLLGLDSSNTSSIPIAN
ncbi:unnamed protein product [Choristocarpus tenellus]